MKLNIRILLATLIIASCGNDGDSNDTVDTETEDTGTESASTDDTDTAQLTCEVSELCFGNYCDQILIPAGEFVMGSETESDEEPGAVFGWGDETPPHDVYLDAFCIDKFAVTYERYLACVEAKVCDPNGHTWAGATYIEGNPVVVNHYPPECEQDPTPCLQYAVNCRSKETAEQYCDWIGMNLCTEAQWERASKGPDDERPYPWGDPFPTESDANLGPWAIYVAHVDSFETDTTPEGVRQMSGNVVEWVSDYYAAYDVSGGEPIINPAGPSDGDYSLGKGGCFFSDPVTNMRRQTMNPAFDKG